LQLPISPGRIHWLCGIRVEACEFRDVFVPMWLPGQTHQP